jgi:hypothetical protein
LNACSAQTSRTAYASVRAAAGSFASTAKVDTAVISPPSSTVAFVSAERPAMRLPNSCRLLYAATTRNSPRAATRLPNRAGRIRTGDLWSPKLRRAGGASSNVLPRSKFHIAPRASVSRGERHQRAAVRDPSSRARLAVRARPARCAWLTDRPFYERLTPGS